MATLAKAGPCRISFCRYDAMKARSSMAAACLGIYVALLFAIPLFDYYSWLTFFALVATMLGSLRTGVRLKTVALITLAGLLLLIFTEFVQPDHGKQYRGLYRSLIYYLQRSDPEPQSSRSVP